MANAWQRYAELASGVREVTRKRAEQVVNQLVKQGAAAAEQAEKLVEELVERSRRNREALLSTIRREAERAVRTVGFVRRSELERLEKRIAELEKQVKAAGRAPAKKAAKKTTAKKATKKAATERTGASGGQ